MKISIVSGAYVKGDKYEDFLNGFKKMKSHGYDATDLGILMDMNNEYHTMPLVEFEDKMREIRKASEIAGIEIYQLHGAWPTFEHEGKEIEAIEAYKREIYGAYLLGCQNVVIHPFMPYHWGDGHNPNYIFQGNVDRLTALVESCEKYNVNVCLENMPFVYIQTSHMNKIRDIVDAVNNKHIKICLDTGHVQALKDDIYECVKIAGDKLGCVHIHDSQYFMDSHSIPFFGDIDFFKFAKGLKEIGYKGTLSLETKMPDKLPDEVKEDAQMLLVKIIKTIAKEAM